MTGSHGLTPRHLSRGVSAFPLGVHCAAIGTEPHGLPDDERHFLAGLRRAIKHGATFLDTADSYGYGRSERVIGRLLREYPPDSIHLGSKVGTLRGSAEHPYAGRRINHQLQQTLDNLYVDRVSLYTMESLDFGPSDCYLGCAIDQMNTLRDLEYVEAIGMCGPHVEYTASPAQRAVQVERFLHLFPLVRPDVIWTGFNALTPTLSLDTGDDLFTFAARHGVGLVLSAPLAQGLLTGRSVISNPSHVAEPESHPTRAIVTGLQRLRDHFGPAPGILTRLALRYCLQKADNCIVVVGFSRVAQIEESFNGLGPPLTPAEFGLVDEIYAEMRVGLQVAVTGRPPRQARV